MPTKTEKKLIMQHKKQEYGHYWTVCNHFEYYQCGENCPCCLAHRQLETGEFQFGACKICLNQ